MRLTKKEALEKTAVMWHWIAEHSKPLDLNESTQEKNDYFAHVKKVPFHLCFCCEYVGKEGFHLDCRRLCPLKDFWGESSDKFEKNVMCETSNSSAYFKWIEAKGRGTRSKYALLIAQAADAELAKLGEKWIDTNS